MKVSTCGEMKLTNSTYEKDRQIEGQFANLIKNILGQTFITKEEIADEQEGTDFAIFLVKPFRVAVRLRRFNYFERFYDEFTIRWSRPSGIKTEIHKIQEGLVNYLLYGFLSSDETQIIQYFIADLKKFGTPQPQQIKPNNPQDSELAIFKMNQFPKEFYVTFYCQPSHQYVWKNPQSIVRK